MCFGCITLSAFTLLIPITDSPQPPIPLTLNSPTSEVTSAQSTPAVAQFREALAEMIATIPLSPGTEILQEELSAIHANLEGVTDISQAQDLVDEGMDAMAQRVMAAPNADELIDILSDLQASANASPQAQTLRPMATLLSQSSGTWGWLS